MVEIRLIVMLSREFSKWHSERLDEVNEKPKPRVKSMTHTAINLKTLFQDS